MNINGQRLLVLLVWLAVLASCGEKQTTVKTKETVKIDSVAVFIVKMDSAQKTLTLPAELLPNERVQVRAKVPGYIRRIYVDIGSHVRTGQTLALIDAPEIASHLQELTQK